VNRFYEVTIPLLSREDIDQIYQDIVVYWRGQGRNDSLAQDAGYAWLDGLKKVIDTLEIVPFHQECEHETNLLGVSVRRVRYEQKNSRREHHVYYTVEEFPIPNPEPTHLYLAGQIVVLFVRHASQETLSGEELEERMRGIKEDIGRINALKLKLEADKF
jgi:hypothetical protein